MFLKHGVTSVQECHDVVFGLNPDGRAVEADPHHIIIEDPDGSCTLILDNMTADDSGQYMCFATSTAGNASTLGKITVQGQSRFLKHAQKSF